MKHDIDFPKVTGVYVVVAQKFDEQTNSLCWQAYILNRNNFKISNVLVSSKGYGYINGEKRTTSILRHFIEFVHPKGYALIETINDEILQLNNEFWVSYYAEDKLFDKKFIFLPDSILLENALLVPELNLMGVIHA
jgi:hypothetical protein